MKNGKGVKPRLRRRRIGVVLALFPVLVFGLCTGGCKKGEEQKERATFKTEWSSERPREPREEGARRGGGGSILGLLTGDRAKIDACKAQLDNTANHLEMYLYEHDEYPGSLDELASKRKGRRKAVLKRSQLKDPWKRKFIYSTQGDGFRLCSSGPDKKEDSEDDVCYGEDE